MKIIIVRHGESEANSLEKEIDNPALSEKGIEQAKILAKKLASEKINKIYSSDYLRAVETAKEICKHHNLEPLTDERLREINTRALPIFEKFEVMREKHLKIKSFFEDIGFEDECILIVAHGSTNLLLMDNLLKRNITPRDQKNACINIIDYDSYDGLKLTRFNDVRHLGD